MVDVAWVFVVYLLAADGKITQETSKAYSSVVACEQARARVTTAYLRPDGTNDRPPGTGVVTRSCHRTR